MRSSRFPVLAGSSALHHNAPPDHVKGKEIGTVTYFRFVSLCSEALYSGENR